MGYFQCLISKYVKVNMLNHINIYIILSVAPSVDTIWILNHEHINLSLIMVMNQQNETYVKRGSEFTRQLSTSLTKALGVQKKKSEI